VTRASRDTPQPEPQCIRFCENELPEDENDLHDPIQEADRVDREGDVQTVRAFQGWLLDKGNIRQLDSVLSYYRHWRMAFRHHLGRQIDDRIAKDMKSVSGDLVLTETLVELTVPHNPADPRCGAALAANLHRETRRRNNNNSLPTKKMPSSTMHCARPNVYILSLSNACVLWPRERTSAFLRVSDPCYR
jgi:hypothetical protein